MGSDVLVSISDDHDGAVGIVDHHELIPPDVKKTADESKGKKKKKRAASQTWTVMAIDPSGNSTIVQSTKHAIMHRTGEWFISAMVNASCTRVKMSLPRCIGEQHRCCSTRIQKCCGRSTICLLIRELV